MLSRRFARARDVRTRLENVLPYRALGNDFFDHPRPATYAQEHHLSLLPPDAHDEDDQQPCSLCLSTYEERVAEETMPDRVVLTSAGRNITQAMPPIKPGRLFRCPVGRHSAGRVCTRCIFTYPDNSHAFNNLPKLFKIVCPFCKDPVQGNMFPGNNVSTLRRAVQDSVHASPWNAGVCALSNVFSLELGEDFLALKVRGVDVGSFFEAPIKITLDGPIRGVAFAERNLATFIERTTHMCLSNTGFLNIKRTVPVYDKNACFPLLGLESREREWIVLLTEQRVWYITWRSADEGVDEGLQFTTVPVVCFVTMRPYGFTEEEITSEGFARANTMQRQFTCLASIACSPERVDEMNVPAAMPLTDMILSAPFHGVQGVSTAFFTLQAYIVQGEENVASVRHHYRADVNKIIESHVILRENQRMSLAAAFMFPQYRTVWMRIHSRSNCLPAVRVLENRFLNSNQFPPNWERFNSLIDGRGVKIVSKRFTETESDIRSIDFFIKDEVRGMSCFEQLDTEHESIIARLCVYRSRAEVTPGMQFWTTPGKARERDYTISDELYKATEPVEVIDLTGGGEEARMVDDDLDDVPILQQRRKRRQRVAEEEDSDDESIAAQHRKNAKGKRPRCAGGSN